MSQTLSRWICTRITYTDNLNASVFPMKNHIPPVFFSLCPNRNPNSKYNGRWLKVSTATATFISTQPSCRTTQNGSFLDRSFVLVRWPQVFVFLIDARDIYEVDENSLCCENGWKCLKRSGNLNFFDFFFFFFRQNIRLRSFWKGGASHSLWTLFSRHCYNCCG